MARADVAIAFDIGLFISKERKVWGSGWMVKAMAGLKYPCLFFFF